MADLWSPPAIARPAPSRPSSIAGVAPKACLRGPRPTLLTGRPSPAPRGKNATSTDVSLLNPAQEQALWSEIIHSEQHLPTALPPSVRRLASMAMEAHDLLCSYAPKFLRASSRGGWDQDAGAFSKWLGDFDEQCGKNDLISQSRLPLDLVSILEGDSTARVPLCTAGFDRLFRTQRQLFDAWGSWQQLHPDASNAHACFHSARDSQTELESCAYWCQQQLALSPDRRLLVITQDLSQRRGEIERAFLRFRKPGASPLFEFSLGVALSQIPPARSALLLLRWLSNSLDENALDWLFSSGLSASPVEGASLQACMRKLRDRDLQRMQWDLESFLNQTSISVSLPPQWKRRMIAAQRSLKEAVSFAKSDRLGGQGPAVARNDGLARRSVAGERGISGACAAGSRLWTRPVLLASMATVSPGRTSSPNSSTQPTTSFSRRNPPTLPSRSPGPPNPPALLQTPSGSSAPMKIHGPQSHPCIPSFLLTCSANPRMPHASHQLDWQFSLAISERLLASAPEVHFSVALQKDDVESQTIASRRPTRRISAPDAG